MCADRRKAARLFDSGMFGNTPLNRTVGSAPKKFHRSVLADKEESLITKPV